MVQGYYTLQEAAQFLAMTVDELRQLAQKGKIRSFQDRGTLRFRIQDIQELARQRGQTSDPELALGESPPPTPKQSSPSSAARKQGGPRTPTRQDARMPDVFDFELSAEEKIDLGEDFLAAKSKSGSSGRKKPPTPKPGSDSDVRLVADGSEVTFSVPRDSDVKLADSNVKSGPASPSKGAAPPPSSGRKSSQVSLGSGVLHPKPGQSGKPTSPKPGMGPQPADSGVRLVPMDSDSDVKIVSGSDEVPIGVSDPRSQTDSNVRLDRFDLPPMQSGEGEMLLTEEINLDEEIRQHEERDKAPPPKKLKAKSELKVPKTSPFELSDSELQMPSELLGEAGPKTPNLSEASPDDSSDFEMSAQLPVTGSSDFDLSAAASDESPLDDSDDFSLQINDSQEQALADETTELTSSSSGISLSNPVDAGISLEDGGSSDTENIDFDLSLEVEDTPRPAEDQPVEDSDDFQLKVDDTPQPLEQNPADSSSEFELTLDSDSDSELRTVEGQESDDIDLSIAVEDSPEQGSQDDDSEFEINLDNSDEGEAQAKVDADSEFELTLDDSNESNIAVDDDEAAQVKAKTKIGAPDEESDIFESDFEVPSDDSTSADSELESSDFDLALDDSEIANEEESGSQVVALDEDEEAETLVDSDDDAAVVDDVEVEEEGSDFGQLDEDTEADADTEPAGKTETVVKEKLIEPAPWGVLPVIFMLPCVVLMFLVGILGFEMVQSSVGSRPPGPLTVQLADLLGQKLKR